MALWAAWGALLAAIVAVLSQVFTVHANSAVALYGVIVGLLAFFWVMEERDRRRIRRLIAEIEQREAELARKRDRRLR